MCFLKNDWIQKNELSLIIYNILTGFFVEWEKRVW